MDEITNYDEDAAPVITDSIAADMGAAGIPVPSHLAKEQPSTLLTRFIEALTNIFKSNSNALSDMNPNNQEQQQEQQQQQAPETQAQQQETTQQPSVEERISALESAHKTALDAKDQEIATLKAQVEALKKAPGDSTSHVVEDEKKKEQSSAEDYCDTYNEAKALFVALG